MKNNDKNTDQPIVLFGGCKKSPFVCAIPFRTYERLSEFTGIEKSARYNLKPKETKDITIKYPKIVFVFINFYSSSSFFLQ